MGPVEEPPPIMLPLLVPLPIENRDPSSLSLSPPTPFRPRSLYPLLSVIRSGPSSLSLSSGHATISQAATRSVTTSLIRRREEFLRSIISGSEVESSPLIGEVICSPRSGRGNGDCFSDESWREGGRRWGENRFYDLQKLQLFLFWMWCNSGNKDLDEIDRIFWSCKESRLRLVFFWIFHNPMWFFPLERIWYKRLNRVDRLRMYILVMKFCFQRNQVNIWDWTSSLTGILDCLKVCANSFHPCDFPCNETGRIYRFDLLVSEN